MGSSNGINSASAFDRQVIDLGVQQWGRSTLTIVPGKWQPQNGDKQIKQLKNCLQLHVGLHVEQQSGVCPKHGSGAARGKHPHYDTA